MSNYWKEQVLEAIGKEGVVKVLTYCSEAIMDCGHEDLSLAIRVVRNICREKDKQLHKQEKQK